MVVAEKHGTANYFEHGKAHVPEADGPHNYAPTDDVNALSPSVSLHSGRADTDDLAHSNICKSASSNVNFHPP